MAIKKILVVGATGVAGSAFVEHVSGLQAQGASDWQLVGVSRKAVPVLAGSNEADAQGESSFIHIKADLLGDYSALQQLTDITHVVFSGYVPAADFAQQVAPNHQILVNCLRALDNNPLERLVLIQGMKYYGSHLGKFKTPAREDDQRHAGENYYYAQQDELEKSGLDWTCLRPHVICGTTSVGTPQNILTVIGVYASLMRESGHALDWPGTLDCYHAVNQATDANLLARAITWALLEPRARNEAYNITNGDFFRWDSLWPRIAGLFNMPAGSVDTRNLAEEMPLTGGQWQQMIEKYSLQNLPVEKLANWPFADYILRTDWDVMASTLKARQHGFQDCLDTEKMYLQHIARLQEMAVLPA